ncbi:hypothetical protein THAOC_00234, partial [Thalassiosira oceanica]
TAHRLGQPALRPPLPVPGRRERPHGLDGAGAREAGPGDVEPAQPPHDVLRDTPQSAVSDAVEPRVHTGAPPLPRPDPLGAHAVPLRDREAPPRRDHGRPRRGVHRGRKSPTPPRTGRRARLLRRRPRKRITASSGPRSATAPGPVCGGRTGTRSTRPATRPTAAGRGRFPSPCRRSPPGPSPRPGSAGHGAAQHREEVVGQKRQPAAARGGGGVRHPRPARVRRPRRAKIVHSPPQLPSPCGSSGFGSAAQFLNVEAPSRPHFQTVDCRIRLKLMTSCRERPHRPNSILSGVLRPPRRAHSTGSIRSAPATSFRRYSRKFASVVNSRRTSHPPSRPEQSLPASRATCVGRTRPGCRICTKSSFPRSSRRALQVPFGSTIGGRTCSALIGRRQTRSPRGGAPLRRKTLGVDLRRTKDRRGVARGARS